MGLPWRLSSFSRLLALFVLSAKDLSEGLSSSVHIGKETVYIASNLTIGRPSRGPDQDHLRAWLEALLDTHLTDTSSAILRFFRDIHIYDSTFLNAPLLPTSYLKLAFMCRPRAIVRMSLISCIDADKVSRICFVFEERKLKFPCTYTASHIQC